MRQQPRADSAFEHLAGAAVFDGVDPDALALLARSARVVGAGSPPEDLAAARGGEQLVAVLRGHAVVSAGEKIVELAGRGEVVGEERIFGAPRATTVSLVGQATALAIPAEAVRRALELSPRLARSMMANIARREIRLLQRVECYSSRQGTERLGGFIVRQLAARDAPQSFQLPAPKNIIASLLSMTKESLSRGFNRLAAAALISVCGRQVRVSEPWRLAQACHCPPSCTACDGISCAQSPAPLGLAR